MKKLLISAFLLVLTLSLTPIVSHAATNVDCSYAGIQCRGVWLQRGDQTASTTSIYFNKGSVIDWGVNNNYSSLGQFQVSVNLWRLTPMTLLESHIVPFGRSATFQYPVTVSGNYVVVVQSGDYSQGRSYAYGWLSE
jgi:hypothetical protein